MNNKASQPLRLISALAGLLVFVTLTCSAERLPEAATAAPRTQEYEWMSVATWQNMHQKNGNTAQKSQAELLFLGDSITQGWTWGDNSQLFDTAFGRYTTANFAIGGDLTQNVLWRLRNGEIGTLNPTVIVLMIGTNNFGIGHHPANEIASGVEAIIGELRQHFKHSKILLMGVLPFDQNATSDSRVKVPDLNHRLAAFNDNQTVYFYDFGTEFLDVRGNIPTTRMADFLHPTHLGYAILAEQLKPVVADLMRQDQ